MKNKKKKGNKISINQSTPKADSEQTQAPEPKQEPETKQEPEPEPEPELKLFGYPDIELNSRQNILLEKLKKKENVFLYGFQETGKTHLGKIFRLWANRNGKFKVNYNDEDDDTKEFDKDSFNVIIYDDVCELEQDFLNYLEYLNKNYKNRFQILLILKSHFDPQLNKTRKETRAVKRIFKENIFYWRRCVVRDYQMRFDFSEKGSQDD